MEMHKENMVRVGIAALMPTPAGTGVFLSDDNKVTIIYIDPSIGASINGSLEGVKMPRPLSHDLMADLLQAFGGEVVRAVVHFCEDDIYHAKLFIEAANEIMHRKLVVLDARPSDCLAMVVRYDAPLYFVEEVWEKMEDVSGLLEKMREQQGGM